MKPPREEPRTKQPAPPPDAPRSQGRRLSYKEQRELESLPARIEALESEQRTLNETVAAPEFYKEPAETINGTLARLDALQHELTAAYTRWDELESRTIRN